MWCEGCGRRESFAAGALSSSSPKESSGSFRPAYLVSRVVAELHRVDEVDVEAEELRESKREEVALASTDASEVALATRLVTASFHTARPC